MQSEGYIFIGIKFVEVQMFVELQFSVRMRSHTLSIFNIRKAQNNLAKITW